MSFLFEIQSKKKNISQGENKKVSMDVRAPQRSLPYVGVSARTVQRQPFALNDEPFDGFHSVAPINTHYAQRVSELNQAAQVKIKKVAPVLPVAVRQSRLRSFFGAFREYLQDIPAFLPHFTPNKLVYGSIMSGVAFGMISLGLIERTFESNATASDGVEIQKVETVKLTTENYQPEKDVFMQYFSDAADTEYQAGVRELVKGHPIEEMLPYIFEKDRITAAFLIGIAKKESNWGKRVPVLDGQDCFNYWGYRGQRRLMGTGGHTCFNSRKDAVETVAKRLENLINSERLDTPEKLIVWKCGMSCEGHSRESVQKWISDVDAYYGEMMALEAESGELEESPEGS